MPKSKSQCRLGFHDWKQIGTKDNLIKSKCKICGKILYSDPNDNAQWMKDHKRDYLQRGDRYYKWIYGENKPFEKKKDPAWRKGKNWKNNALARIFG